MEANKHLTPVFIIYCDGRRLDLEHEGALHSITINDCLNGTGRFSIVFDAAPAKIQEKGHIALGSELSIWLGYKDDAQEVFSGNVLGFRGIFQEAGLEQLEVSGCNALHKLNHASRFRSFENKRPSEAIKGLIEAYSLKAEAQDFGSAKPFQSQENLTDYGYLMRQASAYGKQVYADGRTIYVGDEITVRKDEVIYEWGKSLVSFDARNDISGLISGADYIGWDHQKNESFAGKAELKDLPVKIGGDKDWLKSGGAGGGNFTDTRVKLSSKDSGEAEQLAVGLLQNNSYKFGYAHGKGEGNYKLRPGMRVMVKMVGESFEGEYIAQSVIHRFDRRIGYATEFTLKRNMCS